VTHMHATTSKASYRNIFETCWIY